MHTYVLILFVTVVYMCVFVRVIYYIYYYGSMIWLKIFYSNPLSIALSARYGFGYPESYVVPHEFSNFIVNVFCGKCHRCFD